MRAKDETWSSRNISPTPVFTEILAEAFLVLLASRLKLQPLLFRRDGIVVDSCFVTESPAGNTRLLSRISEHYDQSAGSHAIEVLGFTYLARHAPFLRAMTGGIIHVGDELASSLGNFSSYLPDFELGDFSLLRADVLTLIFRRGE